MSGDLQAYTRAICEGRIDACIRIEQRHDLYGYPPEVVCVGLAAADKGEDVGKAVDYYLARLAEKNS